MESKLMPAKPTLVMLAALMTALETYPFICRHNNQHRDGRQWEVVRMTNEDWREVFRTEEIMGRYATSDEAEALFDDLIAEYAYGALFDAAPG